MSDVVVSDTSCLILLSKIGQLELLQALFEKILITPEVAIEYTETLPEWIHISESNSKLIPELDYKLDSGEATSIRPAKEKRATLIIDELKGRRIAQQYNLKITGTLGILIKAKQFNRISTLKPLLDQLKDQGFRISNRLYNRALELVNE
jgi:predicted nucleic acid-binding protein